MPKLRIQIDEVGFDQFRKQQAVRDELVRRGNAIADAAGGAPDYAVTDDTDNRKKRAGVTVRTATPKAMVDESRHLTLTRALEAGRG